MKIILLALTVFLLISLVALPIALSELRSTENEMSTERPTAASGHTDLSFRINPNDPGSGGGGGGVHN